MTLLEALSYDETEAINELRMRMEKGLPKDMKNDDLLFYRFLKARDFNVDKAEIMLAKHIAWHKAYQVDKIFENFKPTEVMKKYLEPSFLGFDEDGNIVRYLPAGNMDIKGILKSGKRSDYLKNTVLVTEKDLRTLEKNNKMTGKNAYQFIYIYNIDKCTLSKITYKGTTDFLLGFVNLHQDNYPERLKCVYIINAPYYFTLLFSVLKAVMSGAVIQKIHVYGYSGWQEELPKILNPDILPVFLGGNRADPDGDPNCNTFIHHGAEIPSKYFLTHEERYFSDESKVEKMIIQKMSKIEVPVEVRKAGSLLRWEFETKSQDIGFGLFYEESCGDRMEILPVIKYYTIDGTERGYYKAERPGIYVAIFDNTYSWVTSKEVSYILSVEEH